VGLKHWRRRKAELFFAFPLWPWRWPRLRIYCVNSRHPLRTAARIIAYRIELSLYFDPFPERIQNGKC
jgi:hypothetical protein